MRQIVNKWGTTAFQGPEIDGFIVWRSILPAPKEDAEPFKRERPHGGLMGLPLMALLLVVGACPEGMPSGFSRPFDERLSQERGALEAPVDPAGVATAFGHRRDASVFLQLSG